jgi:hypothetical protein
MDQSTFEADDSHSQGREIVFNGKPCLSYRLQRPVQSLKFSVYLDAIPSPYARRQCDFTRCSNPEADNESALAKSVFCIGARFLIVRTRDCVCVRHLRGWTGPRPTDVVSKRRNPITHRRGVISRTNGIFNYTGAEHLNSHPGTRWWDLLFDWRSNIFRSNHDCFVPLTTV